MSTLSFEPLIPAPLWLLLAAVAVPLLIWYGVSRPGRLSMGRWLGVMTLMTAGIVGVLVILLNPTWIDPIPPPAGKPLLTVLVDDSASMATADAAHARTRYDAARQIVEDLTGNPAGPFEVRVRTFSTAVSPADANELAARKPQGQLTNVAAAIAGCLEEDRPQGQAVVLLSDGIHNAGSGVRDVLSSVRLAQAMAAPIYTRTLGGEAAVRDLEVQVRSPQQLAYLGQKLPVTVRLTPRDMIGTTNVSLLEDGQVIEEREVTLRADGPTDVRFEISREEPGLFRYEVRAEVRPDEVTSANNVSTFLLNVVDEPIRVLLLEGKPYWDGKFLLRALASDPAVTLDSVIRMAQGRLLRRTLSRARPATAPAGTTRPASPAEPRRESWSIAANPAEVFADAAKLKEYQVIVLGRDAEEFLTDVGVENLRQWVSREGGALVCYRGSPMAQVAQKLGRLLPVQWTAAGESRFHVQLTDQGRDLRWLASEDGHSAGEVLLSLPTLATAAQIERPKPLTVVLATAMSASSGEQWPVVSYQPYGTGRVVAIEGAGMWRWSFLPPEHEEYQEVYTSLWHSLLRWLVSGSGLLPGQNLDLRADRVSFNTADTASATLLVREETFQGQIPEVELTGGDLENPRRFAPVPAGDDPGIYRVVFGTLPQGQYEARVTNGGEAASTARATFDVREPLHEQLELKARPDLMRTIAEDSGGAVLESASLSEISTLFESHLGRSRPERVRRTMAWDRWWVLIGVLAVWSGAWALRRSGGLI